MCAYANILKKGVFEDTWENSQGFGKLYLSSDNSENNIYQFYKWCYIF